jgi:hypothetical protein
MKTITKNEWIRLLQRDLITHFHEHDNGYKDLYMTPENLIVTITTKTKIGRNYTFGGPSWSAIVDFSEPDTLIIMFASPLKKPYKIRWLKVKEITLRYLSA